MKLVYTHEKLAIVSAAKSVFDNGNIPCFLKNEFSSSMGQIGV